MPADSISAYDLPERVRRYDADMDVMHPRRHKMIEIALDVLPFEDSAPLRILDLGAGTGVFTGKLLERFRAATAVAVDGAESMLELARIRLGSDADRVRFLSANFRNLPPDLASAGSLDAVISSYALHHLSADRKQAVIARCVDWLRPDGWFLNADLVVASDERVEQRIQSIRVAGVTRRAPDGDDRFATVEATRDYLDRLESEERDRPLPLGVDLALAHRAGLDSAEVYWKEYREAVWGGPK